MSSIINNDNYQFKVLFTNEMKKEEINEFISIKNNVLSGGFSTHDFEVKYGSNPFGNSLIILVYKNEECVGCRAFWRNDLKRDSQYIKAYQPCDTAVLSDYRGKGLFSKMSELGLDKLGKDTVMYNFPNDNSLRGNYQLGWELISHLKYTFFKSRKHIRSLNNIDDFYQEWLFSSDNNRDLFYTKRKKNYFLIKKRKKNIYVVISLLKEGQVKSLKLKRAVFPICLIYSSSGKIGRGLTTVGRNLKENDVIPFHKLDTLF